jgi:hypothetical protein
MSFGVLVAFTFEIGLNEPSTCRIVKLLSLKNIESSVRIVVLFRQAKYENVDIE